MSIEVTILIPLFNEEDTVAEAIRRSTNGLARTGRTGEVVIVDDGSTDASRERVLQQSSRAGVEVRLIRHTRNRGVAAALRTGIENSRGNMIVILPADLESNPDEDIPRLLESMSGTDLVSGWRQGRTGSKIVASRVYNFLYRSVLRVDIHDANWIKFFRKPVADHLIWTKDWNRYMILFAARAGFRIREVKVTYYKRQHGSSKFGIKRLPIGFVSFLKIYHEVSKRAKMDGHSTRGSSPPSTGEANDT